MVIVKVTVTLIVIVIVIEIVMVIVIIIVDFPTNYTSTTQFVFGQERSLFPHPKTRNISLGKSKEINLSATAPVAKKDRNREGGWEKNYTR